MGLQGGFAGNRGDWLPVSQSGLVVGSGVQARAVQKSHPNPWPNSDEARKMRLTQEDKNESAQWVKAFQPRNDAIEGGRPDALKRGWMTLTPSIIK